MICLFELVCYTKMCLIDVMQAICVTRMILQYVDYELLACFWCKNQIFENDPFLMRNEYRGAMIDYDIYWRIVCGACIHCISSVRIGF